MTAPVPTDRVRKARKRSTCPQPEAELQLPGRQTLLRRGLQRLKLRLAVRRPQVLDLLRPAREDHTTCTAVAPNVVFTVRMYGSRPPYGPRLVHKFNSHELQTRRSAPHDTGHGQIVAQLRLPGTVFLRVMNCSGI